MQNILELKDIHYTFPGEDEPVVQGMDLVLEKGKFYSMVGASGCGKSTVLRLLCGLLKPDQGTILYQGQELSSGTKVGSYMPQRDLLFPWRTVSANLALPLEIAKCPRNERERKIQAMLERVGLKGQGERYPSELSGGMRQRAAFGRTLLNEHELLLLDEPFSALDALTRMDMQDWLKRQLEEDEKTVVLITHDVDEALYLSDTIFVAADRPIRCLEAYDLPAPKGRSRHEPAVFADLKEELLARIRKEAP